MAAQNITIQCFVKLCTQFGTLLLVNSNSYIEYVYMCTYMYVHNQVSFSTGHQFNNECPRDVLCDLSGS